jgi:hypothetical protein
MGIDLIAGGRRVGHNVRKAPVSQDVYLRLLVKLYTLVISYFQFYSFLKLLFCLFLLIIVSLQDALSQNLLKLLLRDYACPV